MHKALLIALLFGAAFLLAALSGEWYQRMGSEYVRYEGVGPGWDSARVVVGGWPLPYLLDNPSLSPVGSVGLVDGLLGEDAFRTAPFLADVVFYTALLTGFWAAGRTLRRRWATSSRGKGVRPRIRRERQVRPVSWRV